MQSTQLLRLFFCVVMSVWPESFPAATSAATCLVHKVMLRSFCDAAERCASGIGHVLIYSIVIHSSIFDSIPFYSIIRHPNILFYILFSSILLEHTLHRLMRLASCQIIPRCCTPGVGHVRFVELWLLLVSACVGGSWP